MAYFAVLAMLAGLIGLALGNPPSSPKLASVAPGPSATPLQNGFDEKTERLPIALRPNLSGQDTNLTDVAAKSFANVIVALNPTGPRTINGKTGLVLPTSSIVAGYITMQSASSFKLSDLWNSPDSFYAKPAPNDDQATRRAYAENFRKVVEQTVGSDNAFSDLSNGGGPEADPYFAATLASKFDEASKELSSMAVPASAVEFHKAFLAYINDQRNALVAMGNDDADPLKSLVVANAANAVTERLTNDLNAAMDAYAKLDPAKFIASSKPGPWSAITAMLANDEQYLFSIPTANAFTLAGTNPSSRCGSDFVSSLTSFFKGIISMFFKVPTTDSSAEKASGGGLSAALMQCQNSILTQVAKAKLFNVMNAKVLQYIQGAQSAGGLGNPRFITNFEQYFATAGVQGATKAYKDISASICPEFLPQVQNTVFDPTKVDTGIQKSTPITVNTLVDSAATIDKLLGGGGGFGSPGVNGTGQGCPIKNQLNPVNFYNNFQSGGGNGGWDGYLTLLTNTQNTDFGTLLDSHDAVLIKGTQATEAAQAQSIASQGSKADVICTEYYDMPEAAAICTNEQIVTTGKAVTSLQETALNSQNTAVANAGDLAEMDSEVADGLSSQLFQKVPQGIANLDFSVNNNLNSICSSLNVPGFPSSPAFSACNNMLGDILGQFNKYVNLIQSVQSIIGLFL